MKSMYTSKVSGKWLNNALCIINTDTVRFAIE